MNEAMKLTEEPEPTAFLEKSRTMISKGMNLKIFIKNFKLSFQFFTCQFKVIKLISIFFELQKIMSLAYKSFKQPGLDCDVTLGQQAQKFILKLVG